MNYYLDSSAILKLIILEPESKALQKTLDGKNFTSALARLEVLRTVDRLDTSLNEAAQKRMSEITIVDLTATVLTIAENFNGLRMLGSLDAIHLATATLIKRQIDSIVTYDKAMTISAETLGFAVIAPQ